MGILVYSLLIMGNAGFISSTVRLFDFGRVRASGLKEV